MCRRSDVGVSAQEKGIWSRWLAAVGRERILDLKLGTFRCCKRVVDDSQLPQRVDILERLYVEHDCVQIAPLVGFT